MAERTRGELRFLLGEEERRARDIQPDMTVLDYLRRVERRSGVKEGCNEGDCGACSIVIGERTAAGLRYRAVNACIQFMGALDGKQVLSVEDLSLADGAPHPCQQAMVETHGSQCGFCTPGFVMSLFALYHEGQGIDRNRIDDALAGNLCRCTGYGPIIAAARRMREIAPSDRFGAQAGAIAERLAAIDDGLMLDLKSGERRFLAPRTLEQLAQACLDNPEAVILAGGTDVGLWATKQLRRLDQIIHVGQVDELARIDRQGDVLRIGAGARYADLLPVLDDLVPDFAELMRRLGSTQIRNVGTIGGNIANGSPIGDCAPALIALGARLVLRRGEAERSLPLEDFFVSYGKQDRRPGEFVLRVELPIPGRSEAFGCYKISKRFDQDITSCLGAFLLRLEQGHVAAIRIAFGGMAETPKRAMAAEAALLGKAWNEAALAEGLAALALDFQPITDMRAGATYRAKVAGNLMRKFLIETTEPRAQTRIIQARRSEHARA